MRHHLLRPGAARLRLVGELLVSCPANSPAVDPQQCKAQVTNAAVCQASRWPQRGDNVARPLTKQLKAVAQRLTSTWQANAKALQFGYACIMIM